MGVAKTKMDTATNTGVILSNEIYGELPAVRIFSLYGASSTCAFSEKSFANIPSWVYEYIEMPEQFCVFSLKRKFEYLVGRVCVLACLKRSTQFGFSDRPVITQSPGGVPAIIYKENLICSITHSDETASAIIVSKRKYLGVGIDSEKIIASALAIDIAYMILTEEERNYFNKEISHVMAFNRYVALLFSFKESVYKCYRPLVGSFFDFQSVTVTSINLETSAISFKLNSDLSPVYMRGYDSWGMFQFIGGYVHTLTAIENRLCS